MASARANEAYFSLGSNINPATHICFALREARSFFSKVCISGFYRSTAIGFNGTDFINAAFVAETQLGVNTLLQWANDVEARAGRKRCGERFSNRTLDIDLILYGSSVIEIDGKTISPRAELLENYVLTPLLDIAPDLVHPVLGTTLRELHRQAHHSALTRIAIDC
jgi:2-amino-4-hydroxy-6-hydroxymethyldihydropteridine diphosphokinase